MKLFGFAAIGHANRTGAKLTSSADGKTQKSAKEAYKEMDKANDLTAYFLDVPKDQIQENDFCDLLDEEKCEAGGRSKNVYGSQKKEDETVVGL